MMREVGRNDHCSSFVKQRRQRLRHPPGDRGVGFVSDQNRNDLGIGRYDLEKRELDLEAVFRSMRSRWSIEVRILSERIHRHSVHPNISEWSRKTVDPLRR